MRATLLAWHFAAAAAEQVSRPAQSNVQARHAGGDAAMLHAAVFAEAPRAIILYNAGPAEVLSIRALRPFLVWDLAAFDEAAAERLRTDEAWRAGFAEALARVDAVAHAGAALRAAVEEMLHLGLPALDLAEAVAQLDHRVAIAVGSGLGNMLNATPMIRWIAERIGRRVSVIIHGDLAQGVQLFADAPWVDFVYPGFEYAAGRHYDVLVQTALAAHMEPLCTADHWIQQHKLADFNLHGRFIREADVFFLGLEPVFGPVPRLGGPLPDPFVRDLTHRPEHGRIIGLANGIKKGVWAKRQWDKTEALAARLAAEGWTLRCFGMPEELVPHAEDYTGLSIRDTAAEIARCAYFIGHDGGMCHLAEKIGVPTVWLFGPTGRLKNGRWFETSEMVIAEAACSPCNFKLDWLRCETPACMADIGVEQVMTAFARLRETAAPPGAARCWAAVDAADIAQEMHAATSPGRPPGDRREAAERVMALPADAVTVARLLTDILRSGDLDGARGLASALLQRGQADAPVEGLADAILALGGPAAPLQAGATLDALMALQLPPPALRASAEAIAHAALRQGHAAEVPELFERMSRRLGGPMAIWAQRRWIRSLAALNPGRLAARSTELLLTCRSQPDLVGLLRRATRPTALVAEWVEVREEAGASAPMAPGRHGLPVIASPPVLLNLPDGPLHLPRWSTVAILAPSVDPALNRAGSAARLVIWMGRALASLGLCPVVLNWTQASDRPAFELRDNINYVHGARGWAPATWQALLAATAPGLVISLDGAAAAMGIAGVTHHFGLQGLYDRQGLAEVLGEEMSLDLPAPTLGPAEQPDLALDSLLGALPLQGLPQGTMHRAAGRSIGLLLNDDRELDLAMYLVRRCPDLHFILVADVVSRGPEPNVTFLLRRGVKDWSQVAERLALLVLPSTRPANLTAEALEALRMGLPVLATSGLTGLPGLPGKLARPAQPDQPEAWVDAVRDMVEVTQAA